MKCKFEHDGDCCNSGATQYMCKCKKPCNTIIPITNADRIRSMTDEELARALYDGFDIEYCTNDPACGAMLDEPGGVPEERCIACALKWLQQPAEEDNPNE